MTENAFLFDGKDRCNLEHFLSYFENVAELKVEVKKKASALIRYLRRAAFELFYERFAKYGELCTEEKSY